MLSKHTVHSYVRSINHFLSWAGKEGELGQVKAQTPKLPRKIIDVLSREEIDRLERAALNNRDRLIVRLLADTGIRRGELVGLRVSDLVERDRNYYLHVRGKGAPRVYPHVLRHSYATYALTRGMNPIQLAQILGHSSLAMIQNVYSHLSPRDAYEAMANVLITDQN